MRFSRSNSTFANVFVFGDFNVHHKDWLTYSGGTNRPGELCYIFFISNDLTQMVNFPTWIPDCDSHSPTLLNFFSSYRNLDYKNFDQDIFSQDFAQVYLQKQYVTIPVLKRIS